MAEAEEMLESGKPFGMAFVRGNLTALTVNVYKMVHGLVALADGRYADLHERFRVITEHIETILARQPEVAGSAFVLCHGRDRPPDRGPGGGEDGQPRRDPQPHRAARAGRFRHHRGGDPAVHGGEPCPGRDQSSSQDPRHRRPRGALYRQRRYPGPDPGRTADRRNSSGRSRSTTNASRATPDGRSPCRCARARSGRTACTAPSPASTAPVSGWMRRSVPQVYKDIVASKYQSQAIVYRQQRGYRHQDVLMCVGCLAMVDAVVSGVAYSRPPDDPRGPWVLIHAASGLGTQVVEGSAAYDMARVSRDPPHDDRRASAGRPAGRTGLPVGRSDPGACRAFDPDRKPLRLAAGYRVGHRRRRHAVHPAIPADRPGGSRVRREPGSRRRDPSTRPRSWRAVSRPAAAWPRGRCTRSVARSISCSFPRVRCWSWRPPIRNGRC
ncbi:MAG: PEP/pyruvate-binding domain-containing protein [Chromatiales bacterium]|nr:PEP/pyruvate-binding domain-containing protein [Chromatiales bacterium]